MFSSTSSKASYSVILLRHGESVGNFEGRYQGQMDYPLTETGCQQALALAKNWEKEQRRFDVIITSPLKRARQTAETIAERVSAPIEEDSLWMERDVGLLAGLQPGQDTNPRPGFFPPHQPIGEHGESQFRLFLRAGQAIDRLVAKPPGKYLVVSHGGILNLAMYAILGIPVQANFSGARFQFDNCAFASLGYNPTRHQWTVEGVNEHSHRIGGT